MEPSRRYQIVAFYTREKDERYFLDMDDWENSAEYEELTDDPDKNQKILDEAADNYAIKQSREILQTGTMLIVILRDADTHETIWVDYYGRNRPDLLTKTKTERGSRDDI